jgi:hypothetical protein
LTWAVFSLQLPSFPIFDSMKSFYEVLEVPECASMSQIRAAYLKLAREYHPDRVPEHLTKLHADAEEKFKEVHEAWAVLGDPTRRRAYDRRMQERPPRPARTAQPSRPAPAPSSISDLFRHNKDLLKWGAIVIAATLAWTTIGGFVVSHKATRLESLDAANAKTTINNLGLLGPRVRQFNTQPRHIQTSKLGGGTGVSVQLAGVALRREETEVFFRIKAGQHGDFLLYEPPGGRARTRTILGRQVAVDREYEEIYIRDENGAKSYSTTGLVGGEQVDFNLYNFTRRISFRSGEDIVVAAKFPPISSSTSTVTFVSPALGRWQPEWRWDRIDLK